jgi:uncharacterized delta-60 repeat protein
MLSSARKKICRRNEFVNLEELEVIMRHILPFLFLLGGPLLGVAQPPDSLWSRTFGGSDQDFAYSVQQTVDGGYVVAGRTYSFGAGFGDLYVVKTDGAGDPLWVHTYGGSNDDYAYSVQQTGDGGYVVAGNTRSFGAGSADFYVVKTDGAGDTLWTRAYGGNNSDEAYSVQQTADGGYIIGGETRSFGLTYYDFYLVKTNDSGDTLWTRRYGGSNHDRARSVQETADGGYIVAGWTNSFGPGTPTYANFYLVKTNSSGDTLWTHTYGGSNNDQARSVQQTADGGYLVAGMTYSFGAGDYDFYLVKTDGSGNPVWTHTYGGTNNDQACSVQQTADGGYIVAGLTYSSGSGSDDFYLVKTDGSGNSLWTRTYGGSDADEAWAVQQTADGGYVMAGLTYSFGVGAGDFFLVKTGPEGPCALTIYLNEIATNSILRWWAPQACSYLVYCTNQMNEIGQPPAIGWNLEATLDLPAGPAEWTDPAPLMPYKRYGVIVSCP